MRRKKLWIVRRQQKNFLVHSMSFSPWQSYIYVHVCLYLWGVSKNMFALVNNEKKKKNSAVTWISADDEFVWEFRVHLIGVIMSELSNLIKASFQVRG